ALPISTVGFGDPTNRGNRSSDPRVVHAVAVMIAFPSMRLVIAFLINRFFAVYSKRVGGRLAAGWLALRCSVRFVSHLIGRVSSMASAGGGWIFWVCLDPES